MVIFKPKLPPPFDDPISWKCFYFACLKRCDCCRKKDDAASDLLFKTFDHIKAIKTNQTFYFFTENRWLRDFESKTIWPIDIWLLDIIQQTFGCQTLFNRQLAVRYLAHRLILQTLGQQTFGLQNFGPQTFCQQAFDQQTFDQQTFDQQTFDQQMFGQQIFYQQTSEPTDIWPTDIGLQTFDQQQQTLAFRHLADRYMAQRHLVDMHLADGHSANRPLANRLWPTDILANIHSKGRLYGSIAVSAKYYVGQMSVGLMFFGKKAKNHFNIYRINKMSFFFHLTADEISSLIWEVICVSSQLMPTILCCHRNCRQMLLALIKLDHFLASCY